MEETYIVIMLKNDATGFLDTELGSYKVNEHEELIYNIYAVKEEGGITVHLRLSVDRELEDWEFGAVLDYYDGDVFKGIALSVQEDDAGYDPVWDVVFPFKEREEDMEALLSEILLLHKKELAEVYMAISGVKNEYLE